MPQAVLERMQAELLDYRGRGLSVLEMSHRSADFAEIATTTEANFRQLLNIPSDYSVLFMQGGASAQFSLCVQNLDVRGQVAYANTGYWAGKAMDSARALSSVIEVTHCQEMPLIKVPNADQWACSDSASFLHVTDNETIDGIRLHEVPRCNVPLISDMSSSILSQPVDIKQYGMIYAGAQKNIGPAGITLVIVSDELLERSAERSLPPVFSYAAMAKAGSMLNTPPTFAWYAAGLVFQWLLEQGGVSAMAERNRNQAGRVYSALDQHELYINRIHPQNRSLMNIPFQLKNDSLTAEFLKGASDRNFVGLKGHKSIGGLRASLYNATTDRSVDELVDYLDIFAKQHA
ncbi:Phosphoserine aminotransferase [Granulosicoccus antarcticus IMCC3135]|uniref:Phosphoserine aminotransferase n=2 Tax=Granulosicoccus TaxID=437504 RepID=A0A2Z2NVE8_9GAMM|nr:Phosphoserine aminotransferase [Granulosicoccus antarcticus IMCC3135]